MSHSVLRGRFIGLWRVSSKYNGSLNLNLMKINNNINMTNNVHICMKNMNSFSQMSCDKNLSFRQYCVESASGNISEIREASFENTCQQENVGQPMMSMSDNSKQSTREKHIHSTEVRELRSVPLSQKQLTRNLLSKPDQPKNAKVLKVSIIGAPNSGKSTLTNRLVGWRVSSTSSKVHTTRAKVNAILTEEEKQIIFLDTPGITTPLKRKKHHLEKSLLTDPHSSFSQADVIGVVVDVSTPWGRQSLDKEILKALLLHHDKKAILILNKVDTLSSRECLLTTIRLLTEGIVGGTKDSKVIRESTVKLTPTNILERIKKKYNKIEESPNSEDGDFDNKQDVHNYYMKLRKVSRFVEDLHGYNKFEEVFVVSAKEGEGIKELHDFILSNAKPGNWEYHSSVLTDQDPHLIAQQCVWEKLLDNLPQEVPYNIDVQPAMWKEDEYGVLRIAMDLICYNQRHMKLLLGHKGNKIKQIAEEAKQELMNTFRQDLTLMLLAQLKKSS